MNYFGLEKITEHISTGAEPMVGGGAVAALCGALSASLIGLVGHVSQQIDPEIRDEFNISLKRAEYARTFLLDSIERDIQAFGTVLSALKMPKTNEQESLIRSHEIQKGYTLATEIPLSVAETSLSLFPILEFMYLHGNKNAETDLLTATICAKTSVLAAAYNVKSNLLLINNIEYVEKHKSIIDEICVKSQANEEKLLALSKL